MKNHPHLRAYMAGITVPTMFLLVVLCTIIVLRRNDHPAAWIQDFVVFPMALVPNAWGLWNVLRSASAALSRIPIGAWGALLAVVLPVLGYGLATAVMVDLPELSVPAVAVGWLVAVGTYYLVWKHLVRLLNELLGVSE